MRDMRRTALARGKLPSAGYEEKDIMNRKHLFRAARVAARNALGCTFSNATLDIAAPIRTHRHLFKRASDLEAGVLGGGCHGSA